MFEYDEWISWSLFRNNYTIFNTGLIYDQCVKFWIPEKIKNKNSFSLKGKGHIED